MSNRYRLITILILGACLVSGTSCTSTMPGDTSYQPKSTHYVVVKASTGAPQPIITRPLGAAEDVEKVEKVEGTVKVDLDTIVHPNLAGIGGAFNEQGGEAFMRLPEASRKTLAEALFNPETGAGFSLCRTAIGSSDFGLGAYSYSETPNDYEMKHFSVERDTTSVIPFMQAAKAENPNLRIFASPWSPPGWMKENGVMATGAKNQIGNVLKKDPEIYAAYALYFSRYVQSYADHGITINRIAIQNETDMNPGYPGCDMLPDQMAELIGNHIVPRFKKDGLKTEIWAGTFRGIKRRRNDAWEFMKTKASKLIDGLGFQYTDSNVLRGIRKKYPNVRLMHTEGACHHGANKTGEALKRLNEAAFWLYNGAENVCYWNLILNEQSKSGWGWRQNSLVKVDRKKGTVTYNPDFATMHLLSKFIRPGAQLLNVETENHTIAIAVRHKGRVIVFLRNGKNHERRQTLELSNGLKTEALLPANSICAVVFE